MRGDASTLSSGARVAALFIMAGFVLLVRWVYANQENLSSLQPVAPAYQQFPLGKELCTPWETEYTALAEPKNKPEFLYSDPEVCFIVRTYHKQRQSLLALIASLAANNYPNLHIFLVDTQGDFDDLASFESLFNLLYNKDFVHLSNITKEVAWARFPSLKTGLNDYGYLQTDLVVEELSSSKKYQCDYFVATNGDNLYNMEFLLHTVEHTRNSIDLVAVGFASHYCFSITEEFRPIAGCYAQQEPDFKRQRIDVGGALFRKQKVVDSQINFLTNYLKLDPDGTHTEVWFLDGFFFEELIKSGATHVIVPGVYFTHQ